MCPGCSEMLSRGSRLYSKSKTTITRVRDITQKLHSGNLAKRKKETEVGERVKSDEFIWRMAEQVAEMDVKSQAVNITEPEIGKERTWRTRALSRPGSWNYWEWSRLVCAYRRCRPQNFPKLHSYIILYMAAQTNGRLGKLNRMGPFLVHLWQSEGLTLLISINFITSNTSNLSQRTFHLSYLVNRPKQSEQKLHSFPP